MLTRFITMFLTMMMVKKNSESYSFFSKKNTVLMNRICVIYEQLHLL